MEPSFSLPKSSRLGGVQDEIFDLGTSHVLGTVTFRTNAPATPTPHGIPSKTWLLRYARNLKKCLEMVETDQVLPFSNSKLTQP